MFTLPPPEEPPPPRPEPPFDPFEEIVPRLYSSGVNTTRSPPVPFEPLYELLLEPPVEPELVYLPYPPILPAPPPAYLAAQLVLPLAE